MRQNPRLCKYPHKHSDLGLKGIVHFEIKIWYVSAYPKGIQDVGVFFFFSRSNFDVFRSNRSSLSVI